MTFDVKAISYGSTKIANMKMMDIAARRENQGSYRSWKVVEFKIHIFQTWKVIRLESRKIV